MNEGNLTNMPLFIDNPDEMIMQPWKINKYFFVILTGHSITFLIGLLGNIAVIFTLIGERKARNSTYLFLLSLSVADFLLLVVYLPLETLQYFVMQWDEDGTICKLAVYFEFLSALASILNLIAVSVERYIVIVFPMKSRSLCTFGNCSKAVILTWILAIFLSIPIVFTKDTYALEYTNNIKTVRLYYCNNVDSEYGEYFSTYQLMLFLLIPGVIIIICYTAVIKNLWQSTHRMQIMTNNQRYITPNEQQQNHGVSEATKKRKRVIKMLILVILCYFSCWTPKILIDVLIKKEYVTFSASMYIIRVAVFLLPAIHSCLNPFIYSFMSKNLRRSFQLRLGKCICQKGFTEGNRSQGNVSNNIKYRRPKQSTLSTTVYGNENTKNTVIDTQL